MQWPCSIVSPSGLEGQDPEPRQITRKRYSWLRKPAIPENSLPLWLEEGFNRINSLSQSSVVRLKLSNDPYAMCFTRLTWVIFISLKPRLWNSFHISDVKPLSLAILRFLSENQIEKISNKLWFYAGIISKYAKHLILMLHSHCVSYIGLSLDCKVTGLTGMKMPFSSRTPPFVSRIIAIDLPACSLSPHIAASLHSRAWMWLCCSLP